MLLRKNVYVCLFVVRYNIHSFLKRSQFNRLKYGVASLNSFNKTTAAEVMDAIIQAMFFFCLFL